MGRVIRSLLLVYLLVITVRGFSHDPLHDDVTQHPGDHHKSGAGHNDSTHGGNDTDHHTADHDHHGGHHGIHVVSWNFDYVRQPLVITLFLIVVAICKLGFHHANFLSSIVPESCLLIILGTIVGAILHVTNVDRTVFASFSSELFFLFLLPPTILESAYSLHDRVFFANIGTVLFYAVVGTLINFFLIGPILYGAAIGGAMGPISITPVQCFLFSSLIVAVDPVAVLAIFEEIGVNNCLYFLVFGESLLNEIANKNSKFRNRFLNYLFNDTKPLYIDAVTIVLYNMMKSFNEMETIPPHQYGLAVASFFVVSLGGLTVGILFGVLTALLTKHMGSVRVVEPLTVFAFAYTSYLVAELFHFSGIISIIACGLVQAQYSFHNISQKSLTTVKYFNKMVATTCDSIIFMFLGLALVKSDHVWHAGFILYSVLSCLIIRFIVVYFLTFLANRTKRLRIINWEEQFIMAYGGLRGAIAFSLVAMLSSKSLPLQPMFETTTLVVVIFTVFVQGITIKPLVNLLRIRMKVEKQISIYEEINDHVTDHVMAGIEEILGHRGENFIREMADNFDDKYLKHWLQKNPQTKDEDIMELYQEIALQQHYENVAGAFTGPDYRSQLNLYSPESAPSTDDLIMNNHLRKMSELHPELLARELAQDRMRKLSLPRGSIPYPGDRRQTLASMGMYPSKIGSPQLRGRKPSPSIPSILETGSWSIEDIEAGGEPPTDRKKRSVRAKKRKKSGFDETVVESPAVRRRKSILQVLGISTAKSMDEDELIEEPTVHDVRRWLVKNPTKEGFHKNYDKNIKYDDERDLVHHLHQKNMRNARLRRMSAVLASPPGSHYSDDGFRESLPDLGTIETIPEEDAEPPPPSPLTPDYHELEDRILHGRPKYPPAGKRHTARSPRLKGLGKSKDDVAEDMALLEEDEQNLDEDTEPETATKTTPEKTEQTKDSPLKQTPKNRNAQDTSKSLSRKGRGHLGRQSEVSEDESIL